MQTSNQDMISSFEIIRRLSGDKWKFLIITYLFNGKKRFGELLYHVDSITKKVLAENLRELENLGIVYRVSYCEAAPRVEYSLTEIGYSLQPIFQQLIMWSLKFSQEYKNRLDELKASQGHLPEDTNLPQQGKQ